MKKKMLTLLFIIVVLPLIGCQSNDYLPEDKSAIRIALQRKVAQKSKTRHHIHLSGLGFWGPDAYEELQFHFDIYNLLKKDEARYVIVDIAAIFLEEANNDENIRSYLSQYPYSIENLSLTIFLRPNYEAPTHPDYMLVKLLNGKISYKTIEEGQKYGYYSEEEETFEEALEKLHEQGRVPEYFKDYPKL